ncbi:MAG: hypothetical protein U5Q44_04520 [Dehalococcoidia bacterium]|nr:hypothetical protein [Dehalococcoidia bacterium]
MSTEPVASRPRMQDYGIPDDDNAGPMPWADAEAKLRAARSYWISFGAARWPATCDAGVGVWHAGALYFGTGKTSVKARNLAANPAVTGAPGKRRRRGRNLRARRA